MANTCKALPVLCINVADFKSSLNAAAKKLNLQPFKEKQMECLEAVCEGRDAIVVPPTGYGYICA